MDDEVLTEDYDYVSKGFKRALLAFIVTLDEEHENAKRTSQSSFLHFSCMFKHEIVTPCNERAVVYVSTGLKLPGTNQAFNASVMALPTNPIKITLHRK